tara:strand:+ start:33 stop:566 length:534 start_codon:yes stop_codon:yes gene_type:complete
MSISKITENLKGFEKKFPPVEKWNPDLCKGHEFFINREGEWFYDGSSIKNTKLVNLFSSVLKREGEIYYLVTPVEKILVKVELAPYKIIDFEEIDGDIKLISNLNYDFFLDKNHRTRLVDFDKSKIPLVNVRSNIEGFINRNTYYKLVDLALSKDYKLEDELYIKSFSINHVIGKIA